MSRKNPTNLTVWNPEDPDFWSNQGGKRIAMRNLWISIPALLCAFAIWLYWSIIVVQMQKLGYQFDPDPGRNKELFYTLAAVAGLTGATLRIPNSFFIALSGGRNVIAVTTALLILPALGVGIALADPATPYSTYVVLAALSGLGGGVFASSMSNISFFFPKRMQGLSLGLNAGLGNLGVSVMQVLIPFVMTFSLFGALAGDSQTLTAGGQAWIQNAGLVWVPILAVLAVAAWFGMNNLPQHNIGAALPAIAKMLWLLVLAFGAAAFGLWLLLGLHLDTWIVLPVTVLLTVLAMRYLSPGAVQVNLKRQFAIFGDKHNWIMTWLYTMTFGSFIGFSAAFPKLIQDVFGYLPGGELNPNAPSPFAYAWLGPLVGSLARPIGGWISDKWGGARVTQWDTVVMIGATLGVAWAVKAASGSATPEAYFLPFLLFFLLLFITTGIGNGSTFRMIPVIFEKEKAGPVLGWTSAIAAYGAFIIPSIFGSQIKDGTPEYALYGFAAYYGTCIALNWWYYARKNAEAPC